jgi:hypothetical protein
MSEVILGLYAEGSTTDIDSLYEPMGEKIRLERLKELSSYLQFVDDLTETLKELNIIPHTNRF